MQVWEERYTNAKGKKESTNVFRIFQHYLKMFPRDYNKLVHEIYFPKEKYTRELQQCSDFKRRLNIIYRYSSDFSWKERCAKRDEHLAKRIDEDIYIHTKEFIISTIKNAEQSIILFDKNKAEADSVTEEQVVVGDKLETRKRRQNEKADTLLKYESGKSLAIDNYFKMVNQGKIKTENTNKNTHIVKEEGIDYFADKQEYDKEFNVEDFITDD